MGLPAGVAKVPTMVPPWQLDDRQTVDDVEVRHLGGDRGRGLIARRRFTAGEVVLRDRPVVAMQHIFSERLAPCCAGCFRMVGDLESHLRCILRNGKRPLSEFPAAALHPSLRHRRLSLGGAPVPCTTPGCSAVFCEATCRSSELERGCHRVLCSELAADPHRRRRWGEFRSHARRYHENFLLAARAYALIVCRTVHWGVPVRRAMDEFLMNQHAPWHLLPETARGIPSSIAKICPSRRLELLRESLDLLRDALLPAYEALAPGLDELFEEGYYSNLLGEFDLVNVDIEYSHPLVAPLWAALADPDNDLHGFVQRCSHVGLWDEVRCTVSCHGDTADFNRGGDVEEHGNDEDQKADEEYSGSPLAEGDKDDLLPPFLGIGLARAVAFMNHSCEPTCEVDYDGNAVAVVTALRTVSLGEELTISYIDEERTLAERQALLRREYQFSCVCARCCREAAESLLVRGAAGSGSPGAVTAGAAAEGTSNRSIVVDASSVSSGSPERVSLGRSRSRSRSRSARSA